jgi:hypothetical protein
MISDVGFSISKFFQKQFKLDSSKDIKKPFPQEWFFAFGKIQNLIFI